MVTSRSGGCRRWRSEGERPGHGHPRRSEGEDAESRLRDECLNINSFNSLLHAQVVIGDWKTEYNHDRRHSSLGYLAPVDYARQCTHQMETDDSQNDRTE